MSSTVYASGVLFPPVPTPIPGFSTVTVWRRWTSVSDEGVATDHEQNLGSATFMPVSHTAAPFSIPGPPATATQGDRFVITLAENDGSIYFRSDWLASLPTAGIEIAMIEPQVFDAAALSEALPAFPLAVDSQTTVTGASLTTGAGGLTFTGTGTHSSPLIAVASIGFTYILAFQVVPASIHRPGSRVTVVAGDVALSFSGGTPINDVIAEIATVLKVWIADEMTPGIVARLETAIETAAMTAVSTTLASMPGAVTTLPPDVRLTVSRVSIDSSGVTVDASLGTFGSLRDSLFSPPSPSSPPSSSGGCGLPLILLGVATLIGYLVAT